MSQVQLGPNQQKWVDALESGDYKQIEGRLANNAGFCCLGVACEIFGAKKTISDFFDKQVMYDNSDYVLPERIMEELNMKNNTGDYGYDSLATLNDNGSSFIAIATVIKNNPHLIFKGPK